MVVWFTVLGVLGVNQIRQAPEVLRAVSPTYAIDLFVQHPWKAFIALGSIFLVVTGGEALYADMGHFGRIPITWAWYLLVLPGLVLNYFGQAALLSGRPMDHIGELSPFYAMAPDWAIWPLAILATMATVIASQALISGAFSLTVQAVQLDYLPRLAILHTSERHIGQVYVPVGELVADDRLRRPRPRVPNIDGTGCRLRDRRDHHDADHHVDLLPIRARQVALVGRPGHS